MHAATQWQHNTAQLQMVSTYHDEMAPYTPAYIDKKNDADMTM